MPKVDSSQVQLVFHLVVHVAGYVQARLHRTFGADREVRYRRPDDQQHTNAMADDRSMLHTIDVVYTG